MDRASSAFSARVSLARQAAIQTTPISRWTSSLPASESGDKKPRPDGRPQALYGTGKVRVQYVQALGDPKMGHRGWVLDPALSKLATADLELEIKVDAPPKKQEKEKDDTVLIQGTWKVVSAEFDGQADGDLKDAKLIITGDEFRLVVADEEKFKVQPSLSNFGIHIGEFKLDPAKKPKTIDLTQGGKFPFFAIYALDGDNLKLCVHRHGNTNPTEFTAHAG